MAASAAHAAQICLWPQGMKAWVGGSLMHTTQALAEKEEPAAAAVELPGLAELWGDEQGAPAAA